MRLRRVHVALLVVTVLPVILCATETSARGDASVTTAAEHLSSALRVSSATAVAAAPSRADRRDGGGEAARSQRLVPFAVVAALSGVQLGWWRVLVEERRRVRRASVWSPALGRSPPLAL